MTTSTPSEKSPTAQQRAYLFQGNKINWSDVPNGALGQSIADAASLRGGLWVVLTKDTDSAIQLESDLQFFNTDETIEILAFPDWETLPYDLFSPHQDIVSQRLKSLSILRQQHKGILILPITTAMHRQIPARHLQNHSLVLETGNHLDISAYCSSLEAAGYYRTETVYEHGEFAVRGSIVDVFPMGSDSPFRIELFDNEVETLRTFDPETQRSIEAINAINLLPATEYPWDTDSRRAFRNAWLARFPDSPKECPIMQDMASGIKPPGIEYYLPLFYDDLSNISDFFPDKTYVVLEDGAQQRAEQFWREIQDRYEERRHDRLKPILPPQDIFLNDAELFRSLGEFPQIRHHQQALAHDLSPQAAEQKGIYNFSYGKLDNIDIDNKLKDPVSRFKRFLHDFPGKVLICAESAGRREVITELLQHHGVSVLHTDNWSQFQNQLADQEKTGQQVVADANEVQLTVWPLQTSFCFADQFALVSESQLFGHRVSQSRRRKKSSEVTADNAVRNLTELSPGTPVVHIDHGVGRYQGLEIIEAGGQTNEFLMLEYADQAKLYVPVTALHLIARYSGTDNALAPLHKLGTEKWSQAKKKALEKIRDTAAELLNIYAKRAAKPGFQFSRPDDAYTAFCAAFPFEETADQASAIHAVENDMTSKQAMDRLVCGDVGFGKTEVAMRAAFLASYAGKQVAVLAPTTLLAQQHYESFKDRFADTPIKIEVLSRFKTAKEQASAIELLSEGKVDIIIGTHKILQKDIQFKDLGLLIIDEEHRFGVQQKEKIKNLRADLDILTLTATPIPRTLNMAMGGIRDLSIIATPPAKRLSVKTFVRQKEPALTKESILREIYRGGQVFYLHNEVKTIDQTAREIGELIPEARVAVAHGQMRERELEQIMSDFYHKRFNVLVCTTIIETGIDIPSANTIIIERADKFGVAQLHQLRGRVGRSHHQAYAYLLTPHKKAMSGDAIKRLEAISASQDLGAGFTLATHDLEIRGAGELLGEEQSGQIQSVGFTLYMELLDNAVKALKSGKTIDLESPLNHGADINLRIPALIPDDYLPDITSRLILYKRIANAADHDELSQLKTEMIDRFGLLPEPTKNLIRLTELKFRADALGIQRIDAGFEHGKFEFATDTKINPLTLVQLVQQQPLEYALSGGSELKFKLKSKDADSLLRAVHQLLDRLQPNT
ncbi:MAG: transcription-repair coupling factor [Pseudomonadales bacterium]|nr:transcription-repair coupling factor [Pseudomonadales bacterium]